MPVDPNTLRLVLFPDPVLRRPASPIEHVDDEVRRVAERMVEVMLEERGVGLAAPQVGLSWRVFVIHVPEEEGRSATADPATATLAPRVYINPEVTAGPEPLGTEEEGCLSLPDIRGEVSRSPRVRVSALDVHGRRFEHEAAGLLARCIQHEFDHLNGVLIIDRFSQMSRLKNRRALKELARGAEAG